MPIVIFIGNVTASAIGKNKPMFAFGTDIFIAAGTAMYEALAAKIENMNIQNMISQVTVTVSLTGISPR